MSWTPESESLFRAMYSTYFLVTCVSFFEESWLWNCARLTTLVNETHMSKKAHRACVKGRCGKYDAALSTAKTGKWGTGLLVSGKTFGKAFSTTSFCRWYHVIRDDSIDRLVPPAWRKASTYLGLATKSNQVHFWTTQLMHAWSLAEIRKLGIIKDVDENSHCQKGKPPTTTRILLSRMMRRKSVEKNWHLHRTQNRYWWKLWILYGRVSLVVVSRISDFSDICWCNYCGMKCTLRISRWGNKSYKYECLLTQLRYFRFTSARMLVLLRLLSSTLRPHFVAASKSKGTPRLIR
jgi:hypothetical protein